MTEDEFNAMMPAGWIVVERDGRFCGQNYWDYPSVISAPSLADVLKIARNHAQLECALRATMRKFADNPNWAPEYP